MDVTDFIGTNREISRLWFYSEVRTDFFQFRVNGLPIITEKVISPFTDKLHGTKVRDFRDFCKGVFIMNSKGHLAEIGLNELRSLDLNMNNNRTSWN
jgi:hypothetical protein